MLYIKDSCGGDSGKKFTLFYIWKSFKLIKHPSGGPVMIETSDGRWFIVGIVSFGDSPCDGLGVYTNVKAFYSWINSYVSL